MQTIEYRTRDKSGWARGPWDEEPDKKQWQDPATGLACLIVRNHGGALCGYVGVPHGHPWYRQAYDMLDVTVHGGLTFAAACTPNAVEAEHICHRVEPGESDDVWWLGFDCGHLYDIVPGMERYGLTEGTYKTVAYVTGEIESLARQVRDAGQA